MVTPYPEKYFDHFPTSDQSKTCFFEVFGTWRLIIKIFKKIEKDLLKKNRANKNWLRSNYV